MIPYRPEPSLIRFHASDRFVRGIVGAFGSGKSVGMCWEVFFKCKTQTKGTKEKGVDGIRRSRWAVIRNTQDQLKQTALRTWLDWFPDGVTGRWAVSDKIYYLEYDDIKAEILFLALDTPDDVRKLLSLELTGAWVNEARELPLAVIEGLTGRVGRYPKKEEEGCRWSGIIMDTNPPDDDHWWYRIFEIKAKEDPQVAELYEVFHQPPAVLKKDGKWIENPAAENLSHLKKNYYLNLVVGKDPEWIKVYAEGQYGIVSDGRPVYSGYNDQIHCVEFEVNPKLPVHVGWDYSYNGQACVLAQLSPAGQLRIFKEFAGEEIGLHSFVVNTVKPGLQEFGKLDFKSSTGDPAGAKHGDLDEKFALSMLNDGYPDMLCGLPFSTFPADTNSLGPRIDGVNSFLNKLINGAPALLLHPRCSTLRKGFLGRYEFKRVQVTEDRYKDVPNKNKYAHVQDAVQYLCRGILCDAQPQQEEELELPLRRAGYSGY